MQASTALIKKAKNLTRNRLRLSIKNQDRFSIKDKLSIRDLDLTLKNTYDTQKKRLERKGVGRWK